MPTELERAFHDAMVGIYLAAKQECGYNAPRFRQMIAEHGGVGTARQLLSMDTVQSGFSVLWECGRLDLTVECHVLSPRFASLFTEAELQRARLRLRDHKFDPKKCETCG